MKIIYITCFFLHFGSCNFKTAKTEQKQDRFKKPDTIIVELPIRPINSETDYMEMEYFIVVKADTSRQSLVLTKNKVNGRLSIDYIYTPYWKSNGSNENDTTAIIKGDLPEQLEDKKSYEDQIREWEVIMKELSKKYNLSQLKSIRTGLTTFKGFSTYLEKVYNIKYKSGLSKQSRGIAEVALLSSKVKKDLDRILLQYDLTITDVSTDGLPAFRSPNQVGPALDGVIIFKVGSASE